MWIINFVSEAWIKDDFKVIPQNVDPNLITPHIRYAQDAYIKDILGPKFYDSLQQSYASASMNSYETALVELIKPALAYRATQCAIPYISAQIRNKGVNHLNSENAQPVDYSIVKDLSNDCASRFAYYVNEIQLYLDNNVSNFTNYQTPDPTLPGPNSPEVECDIFIEKRWCDRCNGYYYNDCNC